MDIIDKEIVRSAFRLFGIDLYFEGRDAKWWKDMIFRISLCLKNHHLHAACVTGEASTDLYQYYIYNFIHRLGKKLGLDPNKDAARLVIVGGPIINISDATLRSVIIELWREGWIRLYASKHRQPIHFRIGGWGGFTGANEPMPLDIYVENAHTPLASARKRRDNYFFYDERKKKDLPEINKFKDRLAHILSKEADEITRGDEAMLKEKFLFLTRKEHGKLSKNIIKYFSDKGYQSAEKFAFGEEAAPKLDMVFLSERMKEIGLERRTYPGQRKTERPPLCSNQQENENGLCLSPA